MGDVLNALSAPRISRAPEWNKEFKEYNYFITGRDVERTDLTLRIAIADQDEMITLITSY